MNQLVAYSRALWENVYTGRSMHVWIQRKRVGGGSIIVLVLSTTRGSSSRSRVRNSTAERSIEFASSSILSIYGTRSSLFHDRSSSFFFILSLYRSV